MRFSQRMGFTELPELIQRDGMTRELRNSLWNVMDRRVWRSEGFMYKHRETADIYPFSRHLWAEFFKLPIDQIPANAERILEVIRGHFFEAEWYQVYDFLEFSLWITVIPRFKALPDDINKVLERELSGFRVLHNQFVPIVDENEVSAIGQAVTDSPFAGARTHLAQAMRHLSHREDPDYRNSIKESVSAVESACREVTNNPSATLGDALKMLERANKLHGALKAGFSSLYGYASDEDGIRHAMLQEPNITQADAKYFLVLCSAFVNYLAEKSGTTT